MIKIHAEVVGDLERRLAEVCAQLNIDPGNFALYAIDQEIARQEIQIIRDEITIQEISRNVLGIGQSLRSLLDAEREGLSLDPRTCQMCLRDFDGPPVAVEGPLFCDDCMGLARGGDFAAFLKGA